MRRPLTLSSLFSSTHAPTSRANRRQRFHFETLEARAMLHGEDDHDLPNPHTDPVAAADHAALLSLVPTSAVTHRAVQNGEWDDPSTWDHGVPHADANVLIPNNVDVALDSIETARLRTVRVDGELSFAVNANTQLTVDTLIVTTDGKLEIGTEDAPVLAGVTARILIADRGDIDTNWDPTRLSRGLISHGEVSIYGSEVTAFVPLTSTLVAGTTTIVLPDNPVGWKSGDRVILTGSQYGKHDELRIRSIAGSTITVDPLQFDHTIPEEGLSLYLANVSRNVVIESENASVVARRGHAMFMHTPNVDITFAGFYGLGRTDKRYDVNSAQLDATGHILPGTGFNQVGRYSAHFHSTGIQPGAAAAHIRGSAVVDSPGWGIVNHHSHVIAEENVVFDALGAAFVSEAGDEIGTFRGNLAVHSEGSGEGIRSRKDNPVQEFAHEGVGFWMQGSGVESTGNIASGQRSGFVIYGAGLVENGVPTAFPAYNLAKPAWADGKSFVGTGTFPVHFEGNTTFATDVGLVLRFHRNTTRTTDATQIDQFTAWNVESGVSTHYSGHVVFNNAILLGAGEFSGTGLDGDSTTENVVVKNGRIEGFRYGVLLTKDGSNEIDGTHLANALNLAVDTGPSGSSTLINDVTFGRITSTNPKLPPSADLLVESLPTYSPEDLGSAFSDVSVILFNGKEIYRPEQAGGYVPFDQRTPANLAPKEFLGKTNQQIFEQYGLALGGAVAPADATPLSGSKALVGDQFTGRKLITQKSPTLVSASSYTLSYRSSRDEPIVTESQPSTLQPGWNVLTREIGGVKHSFLVYADIVGPTFTLRPGSVLAIHPGDVEKGVEIRGTIHDDFQIRSFRAAFRLDGLQVKTRTDGTQFVTLVFEIRDYVGNVSSQSLEITLDTSVPRVKENVSNSVTINPKTDLSVTLKGLLMTLRV